MKTFFALLSLLFAGVAGQLTAGNIRNAINSAQASKSYLDSISGGTYQAQARNAAVSTLTGVDFSTERVVNYYVMACVFFATNGTSNARTDQIIPGEILPGWRETENWIDTPDYCTWFGISCFLDTEPVDVQEAQAAAGLVLEIELGNNTMNGIFPPEIGLLGDHLVTIDLFANFFHSAVNYEWFPDMTALEFLYFGTTSWDAVGIPAILGTLTNLRELDCSNTFWSEGPIDVAAFDGLDNLNYLEMSNNIYTNSGENPFPTTIPKLPNLFRFYMNGARFNARFPLDFITGFPRVLQIWMDFTKFEGTIPQDLPATLRSFSCIFCGLEGPLPDPMPPLMNRFWLVGNDLNGTIPASYSNLDLDFVYLEDNNFDEASTNIPTEWCDQRGTEPGTLRFLGVDCGPIFDRCNAIAPNCCTCCGTACGNIPDPTPAPSAAPTPFLICYSGDCEVEVEDKGAVKMIDLAIGDSVKVADNKYETIYSFGHKNADALAPFVEITTEGNRRPLEVSEDHMVVLEGGRHVPASIVKVGDLLVTGSGSTATVTEIKTVMRKGLYAPFTESGEVVVNDVLGSNYIAYQDSEFVTVAGIATPITWQWVAHIYNSVHRLAFMFGITGETYSEEGISNWVNLTHRLGLWISSQNTVVLAIFLIPFTLFFTAVYCLETLLKSPKALTTLVVGGAAYSMARKNVSVKMSKV